MKRIFSIAIREDNIAVVHEQMATGTWVFIGYVNSDDLLFFLSGLSTNKVRRNIAYGEEVNDDRS